MPKFVMLWTDVAVWLLVFGMVAYAWTVVRTPNLASNWVKVFRSAPALASSVVLAVCLVVTLADSLHYRPVLASAPGSSGGAAAYDNRVWSVLDGALRSLIDSRESTYSRPLDYVSFTKESIKLDGTVKRVPPRLLHGGAHLSDPETQWLGDVISRAAAGALMGVAVALAPWASLLLGAALICSNSQV